MQCSGGYDYDGKCPQPDICVPMSDDCPTFCPVNCGRDEMFCSGGSDAKGCPREDFCQWVDPYNPYGSYCPVYCGENEQLCPGGEGMPDSCMPIDPESNCPQVCPTNCRTGFEMLCSGGTDEAGCEMPDFCQDFDRTAICQHDCPINCPSNEWPCWMGYDWMGCENPQSCSIDGKCPEIDDMAAGK